MSLTLEQLSKVVGRDTHIYPTSLHLKAGSLNVLLGVMERPRCHRPARAKT